MSTPPGVTVNPDGYTFNWVYTGPISPASTGGEHAGDLSGTGPTNLFLNNGIQNLQTGLDPRLTQSDGSGSVFRTPLQYSTGAIKAAPLRIIDNDGQMSSTPDPSQQVSSGDFRLSNGDVTPPAPVFTVPSGSRIVVRGEIEFRLLQPSPSQDPVPGSPVIKAYVLATVNGDGTYNNFGMAMSHNVDAMVAQYNLSALRMKVVSTKAPTDVDICFSADALIDTDRGPVRAGDLEVGDRVRTRDAGFQPIRWIGKNMVPLLALSQNGVRPIRIRAGALGDDLPKSDLVVSPQHRVLVRSRIAQKMFGTDEVLVAAKQLLQIDGVDVARDLKSVTYVHFLFDDHQIVFSNGAETESLYTGAEALKTVGDAAMQEIFTIFPELAEGAAHAPARLIASGRMGRKLAVRHSQNNKALVT